MGQAADDIIDGLINGETGEFIDGDAPGYPRSMRDADPKRKAQFERKLRFTQPNAGAPERPHGKSAAGVVLEQIRSAGGAIELANIRIPWVHQNQVPAVVQGLARKGRVEVVGTKVASATSQGGGPRVDR